MLLRFIQKVPVVRLLIPYLAGLILLPAFLKMAVSLLLFGFWGLLFFRYLSQKMSGSWSVRWFPGICFFCLWMGLGGLNAGRGHQLSLFPEDVSTPIFACVKVQSIPVEKPKSIQCEVSVEEGTSPWPRRHIQLYMAKDSRSAGIKTGDRLFVRLKPQQPESPTDPGAFDYAAWLRNKGICATSYIPAWAWCLQAKASWFDLKSLAERARKALLTRFGDAGISGSEYALASALTLGSTNLLTSETKQQFSISGVSHILSVSGLHVAVVYAVLAFLLSFLDRWEWTRVPKQVLIVLLLFGYAFMTGLSPSVIRSALMFSLMAVGKCLYRKSQTVNTVLFSAFALLLWDPAYFFDLGFELSYCAVLSIVVVHPRMVALWMPSTKVVGYLWEMICLSLVAQMGTAPLTVYFFHQFPNYFLLNNLVAVPFSSLIIYVSVAFLFLSGVPVAGLLLTKCLNACLHGFLVLVETMGGLPYALTENLYLQRIEVVFLYLLMGSFFVWFFLKRRRWVYPFLITVICLQGVALSRLF
jgi:competence protein ComEC